jgi:hypothetical protein
VEKYIWIAASRNRTLVSMLSETKIKPIFFRLKNRFKEFGIIGSFENLVTLNSNPDHKILYLIPWWIWTH